MVRQHDERWYAEADDAVRAVRENFILQRDDGDVSGGEIFQYSAHTDEHCRAQAAGSSWW